MLVRTIAATLVALSCLTACTGDESSEAARRSAAPTDEAAAAVDEGSVSTTPFACPENLKDIRQGPEQPLPAEGEPALPTPARAWVCVYSLEFADPGEKPKETWRRSGPTVEAKGEGLERIRALVAALHVEPDDNPGGPCPANLGPIWVLMVEHAGTRSGLTYADFGCHGIGLTEGPKYQAIDAVGDLSAMGGMLGPMSFVYESS